MKMFLYYALHSFVNQIKKLFRTWVIGFMLICLVCGGVIGVGVAVLSDTVSDQTEQTDQIDQNEQVVPEEEPADPERAIKITELVLGGLGIALFAVYILSADKSGSSIFIMADVNLLFSSPLSPQSVLMFRLMSKIGMAVLASIYVLFQLPNLASSLSLTVPMVLSLLASWFFILIYGQLLSVLVYTVSSTRPRLKKYIQPAVYGTLICIAAAFFVTMKSSGRTPLDNAVGFFGSRESGYIPVWGWIKVLPVLVYRGRTAEALVTFALLAVGVAVLIFAIRSVKADFYEDAMTKSEELAEKLASVSNGQSARRTHDRTDRLRRDGLNRGSGASVYFFRSVYNRFRFAFLGFITKTCVTYSFIGVAVSFLLIRVIGYRSFLPAVLVFGAVIFYRALGNSSATDVEKPFFFMIPSEPFKKIAAILLGGSFNCLLDILPGLIIAGVLLGASPFRVTAALLFLLSVDLFSSAANMTISLSLPVSLSKQVCSAVTVMFIYFGLIPVAAVIVTGFVLGRPDLFILISAGVNILISAFCALVSQVFVRNGRR